MTVVKGSADHKQHLNLSPHAFHVIYHDMFTFMHSDSLSGFVNTVFSLFFEYADASVSLSLIRKEDTLRQLLSQSVSEKQMESVLTPLLAHEKEMLLKKIHSYGNGCMMKIRLNNENFSFLYPDEQEDANAFHFPEDQYYKSVGQYVKTVLEEYAEKSFFEREEIFYRNTLQMLDHCAANGTLLRLKFMNGEFDMKPYGVFADREGEYHFLAGISCPKGAPATEEQITSVRLSQILSVQTRSYRSGRLTHEQKKQIQQLIRTSGIQFLNQDPAEEIVVYMTKEGVRKYRKMLHLRPLLIKKEDYEDHSIYHFHCTQLQARFYLFRLGGDTLVLKPDSLREALKERYLTAATMYQKDPQDLLGSSGATW